MFARKNHQTSGRDRQRRLFRMSRDRILRQTLLLRNVFFKEIPQKKMREHKNYIKKKIAKKYKEKNKNLHKCQVGKRHFLKHDTHTQTHTLSRETGRCNKM